ncbi:hypothetical protein CNMCM5623_009081 [Aspergillus felis]|uniref:Uncharacterized protein n=1 Tax=Aspergillus felis TaxID=1287682 RepID=A0A8H6V463_9EURO|nr:hypothetical protein CNMCM5623_009081 [Aspergillus felis]
MDDAADIGDVHPHAQCAGGSDHRAGPHELRQHPGLVQLLAVIRLAPKHPRHGRHLPDDIGIYNHLPPSGLLDAVLNECHHRLTLNPLIWPPANPGHVRPPHPVCHIGPAGPGLVYGHGGLVMLHPLA